MANAVRGQVSLVAGDTTYTLVLSINAMCEIEDTTGKDIVVLVSDLQSGKVSMKSFRLLFWAALQDYHPDVDLKAAGILISEIGMTAAMGALGEAFERAFPDAEENGSRPPKAKAG